MNRRSFPAGQASAALLKALLRLLVEDKGQAAADAWLRGVRMDREDLDDETRMLPLPTVHRALVGFAEAMSPAAIAVFASPRTNEKVRTRPHPTHNSFSRWMISVASRKYASLPLHLRS